jgi:hypothetical protein
MTSPRLPPLFCGALARAAPALLACAHLSCSGAAPAAVVRSAVTCAPCEARADGFGQLRVRVSLRSAGGRPVPGVRVVCASEHAAVTGEDGTASFLLSSRQAGSRQVQVRLSDGTPVGSVAVTFFAGSLPRVDLGPP